MAKRYASSGFAEAELKKSRKTDYDVNKNTELPYLRKILGEDKILINVSGDKRNPTITYRCKQCNGDYKVHYSSLKKQKGHDCSALVSSGEVL